MLKAVKRVIDSENKTHDPQTGEVEDGKLMWVPHKTRSQFGSDWFQMAQDTLRMINAHRNELGLEGIVVFNALMARLDFENFIQVSQADIASELRHATSNVSRAMKRLDARFHPKRAEGRKIAHPSATSVPCLKGKARSHMTATSHAKRDGWKVIQGGQATPDL